MSVLDDPGVQTAFRQAWLDSQPGTEHAHEEGGFVLREKDGSLRAERWPRGDAHRILVPDHTGGLFGGLTIVATFHTHPHAGSDFREGASLADVLAVIGDTELHSKDYESEYVIGVNFVERITSEGTLETVGATRDLLDLD